MPIYEYHCKACKSDVEILIRADEKPACPECSGNQLEKLLSITAAPATSSSNSCELPMMPNGGGCGLPQCGQGRCMGSE